MWPRRAHVRSSQRVEPGCPGTVVAHAPEAIASLLSQLGSLDSSRLGAETGPQAPNTPRLFRLRLTVWTASRKAYPAWFGSSAGSGARLPTRDLISGWTAALTAIPARLPDRLLPSGVRHGE